MRILLVEDNIELGQACKTLLEKAKYAVDWVENGDFALAALATDSFELIILDLSLPDMDGIQILKKVRNKRLETVVLILTARGSLEDRIKGLDLGADDYMTKPFDLEELLARTRMLIRRVNGKKSALIEFGSLTLDLNKFTAFSDENRIELTAREFALLRVFCTKSDMLLSKEQIAQNLTSFDEDISPNAIEQIVSRLRKKLIISNVKIHSARGLGYILMTL